MVELGTDRGTARRAAVQLGCGFGSVRSWVRQADIGDGLKTGVALDGLAQMRKLEQENRELKSTNEILKRAAALSGEELDRQHKMYSISWKRLKTSSSRDANLVPGASAGCCRWRQVVTIVPRRPGRLVTP